MEREKSASGKEKTITDALIFVCNVLDELSPSVGDEQNRIRNAQEILMAVHGRLQEIEDAITASSIREAQSVIAETVTIPTPEELGSDNDVVRVILPVVSETEEKKERFHIKMSEQALRDAAEAEEEELGGFSGPLAVSGSLREFMGGNHKGTR